MTEDEQVTRQRFTHALLSPLTVILGSIEMLLNQAGDWPECNLELLRLAMAQGQRLQETLNTLIASAEVEGNTVRLCWVNPATPQADSQ